MTACGYASLATPFGARRLCIVTAGNMVCASDFTEDEKRLIVLLRISGRRLHRAEPLALEAASQARAYFAQRLRRFDLPLSLEGTPIEIDSWRAVAALDTGTLVSYADVARAIGRPRSHRGVARAMARTPLDLFIPAHRVLGSDATIKGDAQQTAMRRILLAFEGHAFSRAGRLLATKNSATEPDARPCSPVQTRDRLM